ncbi:Asp/Glu racemase [uncultured Altererythrobacter sp.]|uniref:maleate cis-trans isomerase family protein n=1 Tax=uncultured Altererythrobacter sp. TaxID=500840 RepID=UPI0025CE1C78|nr:Asp/Glu racemase [uncultured Altererythrobacter sp.]
METEIPAMLRARERSCPERFTFHSSRMRMMHVVKEELAAMDAQSLRCALELADARVDVMGYACLVAIMAMGPGYHRKSQEKLSAAAREADCTSPVITSAGALITTLKELGLSRVAVLAPYMKPLTQTVIDYIEAEDIEVCASRALEISDNLAVGRRLPEQALEEASRIDLTEAQALVLSACVQMPAAAAIDAAEQKFGLPVVTASSCTVRQMLKSLDLTPVVAGYGAALSSHNA